MLDLSGVSSLLPDWADYLIYTLIALVTLTGFIKCLFPLWRTTGALRRAINRLQRDAGSNREIPVWQEPRFVGGRLMGSWMRFLQNAEQLDRRALPCNVEDYINDDTVTNGPGNATLAELIPNMLTSLGILGTFMGMMRGLSALNFSDAASLIAGIPTLLKGMQFAFGTSIAGIGCSLAFNMLNRISQGSSYRAIDDFVDNFTQLAMKRPLDNDVQMICQNQDRNMMLINTVDNVLPQMAGSVEAAMTRAVDPMVRSMDSFLQGATRAQVDGVGRIVTQFITRMNESLGNQFLALSQTLTELNQRQQLSFERLEDALASSAAMVEDAEQLRRISNQITGQFERYVQELGEARRRDESFEAESAQLLHQMHQAMTAQEGLISRYRDYQDHLTAQVANLQHTTQRAAEAMGKAGELGGEKLLQATDGMREASQTFSRSYQGFVQSAAEGMQSTVTAFERNMDQLVKHLTRKMDDLQKGIHGEEQVAQLGNIQRMMGDMQATLRTMGEAKHREEA